MIADAVVAGFASWLRDQRPNRTPEIVGVERPSAGFSSDTFLVDLRHADDLVVDRVVLKLPPAGQGIFPDYDFDRQARVQNAVAAAGIPAAAPAHVELDARWAGAPFLVMPAIAGHIVGEVPVADQWLTCAEPSRNTKVHHGYFDVLADIHRVDWRARDLRDVVPHRDNAAELAHWRDYLAWYGDGTVLAPTLVDALDWCDDHRPTSEPAPSLLWGDVRLGNVIFDEERAPVAVLDWEMTTIGAAEHDLAWALALGAVQDELLKHTVPGFLDRDAAVARYEARLGRPVQDLPWYEVFALVRSTAIMTRIAHLRALVGEAELFPIADNPILTILLRRIKEAEETR